MIPEAIDAIKDKILGTVDASKIYLFGSYARGTQTTQSDYDFFVVIPDNSMRPMEAIEKLKIPATDKKINSLAYKLYSLAEFEISFPCRSTAFRKTVNIPAVSRVVFNVPKHTSDRK